MSAIMTAVRLSTKYRLPRNKMHAAVAILKPQILNQTIVRIHQTRMLI